MNVYVLLLTTVSAGQHPAPIAAPAHAAPVASASCGCGGACGAVSDCCVTDCCTKQKKSRSKKSKDCCAPSCCAPTCEPSCGATSCCQPKCIPVESYGIFARKKKNDCCQVITCDSCCTSGCATGGCANGSCGAPVISAPAAAPALIAPAAPLPGTIINQPAAPKAAEPIKKMPSDANKGALLAPLTQVAPTGAKIESESKNPFDSDRRHDASVANTTNYGRLTGQLSFVHADGGLWVLRYAPLSQEDANGGSVVLARDRMMTEYKEGDIVAVEGKVIREKGSSRLGGPLYQVQTIRLVNRSSN